MIVKPAINLIITIVSMHIRSLLHILYAFLAFATPLVIISASSVLTLCTIYKKNPFSLSMLSVFILFFSSTLVLSDYTFLMFFTSLAALFTSIAVRIFIFLNKSIPTLTAFYNAYTNPRIPYSVAVSKPYEMNPFYENFFKYQPVSSNHLIYACAETSRAIAEGGSLDDVVKKISLTRGCSFVHKIWPLSTGYTGRINHLNALCRRACALGNILDIEGVNSGRACGTADIVYTDGYTVILEDITVDAALYDSKMASLTSTCNKINKSFGKKVCEPRVYVYDPIAIPPIGPLKLNTIETEMFKAMADVSEAIADANLDPDTFISALRQIIPNPDTLPIPLTEEDLDLCTRVATGREYTGDVTRVLDLIRADYPILFKVIRTIGSQVKSDVKGVPPPNMSMEAKGKDEMSWASILYMAKDMPIGYHAHWDRETGSHVSQLRRTGDIILKKVSEHYFDLIVTENAPEEWILMSRRENARSPRAPDDEMESIDVENLYKRGNDLLENAATQTRSCVTSIGTLAHKLLREASHVDKVHSVAAGISAYLLDLLTRTIGYQTLAATQSVVYSGTLAASAGTASEFRLCSFYGDRILCLAKKTGDISHDNDTKGIFVVANPIGPVTSWETRRENGFSLGKCIFFSSRLRNHLDKSLGAATTIASVYTDGSSDFKIGVDSAAAFCYSCLGANKNFGVAVSAERAMSEGVCAISNSTDEVAKKISECHPSSLAEATILLRIAIRSAACALMRDTGSLRRVITLDHSTSTSTPVYVPAYAPHGKFTYTGIVNAVYDYHSGSDESPSAIRNEAKALIGVFKDEEDYHQRLSEGDQSLWCMSAATLRAWRDPNIDLAAYVRSPEFIVEEILFLNYIVRLERRHTTSLALMVSFAKRYSSENGLKSSIAAAVDSVSEKPFDEFVSNKNACEISNLAKDHCSAPAYRTLIAYLSSLFNLSSGEFKAEKVFGFISSTYGFASSSIAVLSVLAMIKDETFYVISKAKDLSVEKTRDFFMMSANMRYTQGVMEKISREVGKLIKWSALTAPSKIQVLNGILDNMEKKKGFPMATMTDKTRYGPSRIPGALYGVMYALGVEGGARMLYRSSLAKMMSKKIRPSDTLMNASPEEIDMADRTVAPGIKSIIIKAKDSSDWSLNLVPGTGQGLTQSTSDVYTGVATGITEKVARDILGFCEAKSTNDDGVTITRTKGNLAWNDAKHITDITLMTGYATGEVSNRSKIVVSTWGVNLNTQFRAIGDTVGKGRGTLPWSRELMSVTAKSSICSLKDSAMETLTFTNGAADEGAPLMALIVASAVKHAVHYTKFRFAKEASESAFLGHVPSTLGPPIFAPYYVRALGPLVVEVAMEASRSGGDVANIAQGYIAKQVLKSTATLGSFTWVDGNTEDDTKVGFDDFTLVTMPFSRTKGDMEMRSVVERVSEDTYGINMPYRSLSESVAKRLIELRDFSLDDQIRSATFSVHLAASAYAVDNARVSLLSARVNEGVVTISETKIKLEEMFERLKLPRPSLGETPLTSWGLTARVIQGAEFMIDHIVGSPKQVKIISTVQRYYVRSVGLFSGKPSEEERKAIEVMIAPKMDKPAICKNAARGGVYIIPYETGECVTSLKRRIAISSAAEQLISAVYVKNPPPVIVNEASGIYTLADYLRTAPMADLGVTLRAVQVSPSSEPKDPEIAVTQEMRAIKENAIARYSNIFSSCINFNINDDRANRVNTRIAPEESDIELSEDMASEPEEIVPRTKLTLSSMLKMLSPYRTRVKVGTQFAKVASEIHKTSTIRRFAHAESIKNRPDVKILTRDGEISVLSTEVRLDIERGRYLRTVNVLSPIHPARIFTLSLNIRGVETNAVVDDNDPSLFTADYGVETMQIRVVHGLVEGEIFTAAYPGCFILEAAYNMTVHKFIIAELPRDMIPEERVVNPPLVGIVDRVRNPMIDEQVPYVINFIASVEGLAGALASKGTSLHPLEVTMALRDVILEIDEDYIPGHAFRHIWSVFRDARQLGVERDFLNVLTAMMCSSRILGGDFVAFPGHDGPNIRNMLRRHLYTTGQLSTVPGAADIPVDPLTVEPMDYDALENYLFRLTELADEEDFGLEEIEDLMDLGGNEAIDLGVIPEDIGAAAARALGITLNVESTEVLTSSAARAGAEAEDYVIRTMAYRRGSFMKMAEIFTEVVLESARSLSARNSGRAGTSAVVLTSGDAVGLRAGPDSSLYRISGNWSYAYSALGSTFHPRILSNARARASREARREGLTEVNAVMGMAGFRAVTYEEARDRGMVRSINSRAVLNTIVRVADEAHIEDLSSLSYIGTYGEVNMGA